MVKGGMPGRLQAAWWDATLSLTMAWKWLKILAVKDGTWFRVVRHGAWEDPCWLHLRTNF